ICLVALCAGTCLTSRSLAVPDTAQQPECIHVFRGIRPAAVALSPCERYLAAGGNEAFTDTPNSLLLVWDLQTKKEVFRYRSQSGGIQAVTFSPSGKQIAAVGVAAEKGPKVWDFP